MNLLYRPAMAAMAATASSMWVSPCVQCRRSPNFSAASSSFLQSAQSKKLKLQARHGWEARGDGEMTTVASIAPPPWPPVNPDTVKEGEASVGMEAALKQEGGEEAQEQQEKSAEAFVWRDHWYPVSLIEDLDPSVPTPFQLLGRELVVWKDTQGEWRVFLDKCPHRLAPLSVSFQNIATSSIPRGFVSAVGASGTVT